jgi:hypothetical protein
MKEIMTIIVPVHYRGKNGKGVTNEKVVITLSNYLHYYRTHRPTWR